MRRAALALRLASIAWLASCATPGDFVCTDDDQCTLGGVMGICQPATSYCSLPDPSCPSGQRYYEHSGSYSSDCVGGSGPDGGGPPVDGGVDAAGPSPVDAAPGPDGAVCGEFALPCCDDSMCSGDLWCGPPGCTCYAALAAGREHVEIATTSGDVWGWGNNGYNQLGNGGQMEGVPYQADISNVYMLTAGYDHTCGKNSGDELWCWGRDAEEQLGNGGLGGYDVTAVVGLPAGVHLVSAGWYHTCATTYAGELYCWGYNEFGQVGQIPTSPPEDAMISMATLVPGVADAYSVAGGSEHTCFVVDDDPGDPVAGEVWCMGHNDADQLGNSTVTESHVPMQVAVDADTEIHAGAYHTCVANDGGGLSCWGDNSTAQLGLDTDLSPRATPYEVPLPNGVNTFGTGWAHTCAVTYDEELWCWGSNDFGQLALPIVPGEVYPPTQVMSNVSDVVLGGAFTCALTNTLELLCWGSGGAGELGIEPPVADYVTHVPVTPTYSCAP